MERKVSKEKKDGYTIKRDEYVANGVQCEFTTMQLNESEQDEKVPTNRLRGRNLRLPLANV